MTACRTTCSVSRRKSMSASPTCLRMMSRASIVGVVTEILLVCWVMLSHEDDAVANRYPVDPLLTPRPGTLLLSTQIQALYLTNQLMTGLDRFKVLPTQGDR